MFITCDTFFPDLFWFHDSCDGITKNLVSETCASYVIFRNYVVLVFFFIHLNSKNSVAKGRIATLLFH